MSSSANKIVRRIEALGPGAAFCAKDFLDLGRRGSVDVALSTLAKAGKIRRVCRGVYDNPVRSQLSEGWMAPDYDQVAHALARKTGSRIHASGAVAANLLGLSEQVPAKIVYMSDGRSKTVTAGNWTITFRHISPKELPNEEKSALVLQALRFTGKENINSEVIKKIRSFLKPRERKRLLVQAKYAADWLVDAARGIAEDNHG